MLVNITCQLTLVNISGPVTLVKNVSVICSAVTCVMARYFSWSTCGQQIHKLINLNKQIHTIFILVNSGATNSQMIKFDEFLSTPYLSWLILGQLLHCWAAHGSLQCHRSFPPFFRVILTRFTFLTYSIACHRPFHWRLQNCPGRLHQACQARFQLGAHWGPGGWVIRLRAKTLQHRGFLDAVQQVVQALLHVEVVYR